MRINTPKQFASFVKASNPNRLTGLELDVLYEYTMEYNSTYIAASDDYEVSAYDISSWESVRITDKALLSKIRNGDEEGVWLHVLGNRYLTYPF